MRSDVGQGYRTVPQRIVSRLSSAFCPKVPRLGIDIGSKQIKVVESVARNGQLWMRSALCFDTPPQAVSAYAVHHIDTVARAIRAHLDRTQTASSRAIASIPGPSAMVKRFNIASAQAERLDAVIRAEVENLAPAASDSLCVDYQVSERIDEDGLEVIVVAARSELVESYACTLEHAGLVLEAVDVDCLALANMFEANHGREMSRTIALVHVGARFSSITIYHHGRPALSGDAPAGTFAAGESEDSGEAPWADRVALEIERALRFYWPTSAGDRIDEIFVSGGAAREPRFLEALVRCTGCRATTADPFACMRQDVEGALEVGLHSAQFAVAVGLAVRSLEEP